MNPANQEQVTHQCLGCKQDFQPSKLAIKQGHGKFCQKCSRSHRRHPKTGVRVSLTCANPLCGIQFERLASRVKLVKYEQHFCSRPCKDQAQHLDVPVNCPPQYKVKDRSEIRRIAFSLFPARCNQCGYDLYKSVLRVLQKEEPDDLEILCPTCLAVYRLTSHSNTVKMAKYVKPPNQSSVPGTDVTAILSRSQEVNEPVCA